MKGLSLESTLECPYDVSVMSARDILNELPKLKPEERRAIASRIFELEESEELSWATQAADVAFQELDRLEERDGSSSTR